MPERQLPDSLLITVAVLLVAGAAIGSIVGVMKLKRYVDGDPRLCAHCHKASPDFALWTKGSHKSVACQRCHHSTPEQGLAMLKAFLTGRNPGGATQHAPVEVGSCAACHDSHDANWPQVGASRGHRIHYQERKIACVTCHAEGMHGFHPLTEACRKCHGEHTVRARGMAKLHCFTCHDFLSPDPGLRPTRRDCLRCHRSEGVHPLRFAEDAPMQLECGACHKPHAATPGEALVACSACHAQAGAAGLHASRGHGRCLECHPAHLWRATRSDCLRCHGGAPAHAEGKACAACHSFRAHARPAEAPRKG